MPRDHGFYIRVFTNYPTHPKTIHLKLRIGPQADCFPIRLWTWAAQFAKDGIIRGGAAMLEAVLGWTGKPGELHKGLMSYPEGFKAGFLEQDGITIHDWMDGTGAALKAYEETRERNRIYYQTRKQGKNGKHKSAAEIAAEAAAAGAGKGGEEGSPF